MTTAATDLKDAVWRALGTVLDPELDQPITELQFIAGMSVGDREISVDLRLPTYFCAPNFAYLMVADAQEAIAALGVPTRVRLLDHFAAEEINAGVAAGEDFRSTFPGLASGELAELRRTFLAKAHAAYQEQVAAKLLRGGHTHDDLVRMRLRDVPEGKEKTRLARKRSQLGLPVDDETPLLIDDTGEPMSLDDLPLRLRLARTTRVSIDSNAEWCRGLLDVRYGATTPNEATGID